MNNCHNCRLEDFDFEIQGNFLADVSIEDCQVPHEIHKGRMLFREHLFCINA